MKTSTIKKLTNIMAEAAVTPKNGEAIEVFAIKSFKKFQRDLTNLMDEGDVEIEVMSMVGMSIEAQYKGARNAEIRIGMLNLMVKIADYCYRDETDKEQLALVKRQTDTWKKEAKIAKENLKKLKNLTPDDILNAPPIGK